MGYDPYECDDPPYSSVTANDPHDGLEDPDDYWQASDSAFLAALRSEDDVGLILRVHLQCERILREMLLKRVSEPDSLKQIPGLRLLNRAYLLHALGALDDSTVDRMKWLDNIRNSLSHEPERRITSDDFKRCMDASGAYSRESIRVEKERTHSEEPLDLVRIVMYYWYRNLTFLSRYGVKTYWIVKERQLEQVPWDRERGYIFPEL